LVDGIPPCKCGRGAATLSLPIGGVNPRWCSACPSKPWNAIKRCECQRKKARFGPPGGDPSSARWCSDCPARPPNAVNVTDAPARALTAAAGPRDGCPAPAEPGPCVCGRGRATLALPIQSKLARWCPECPTRPHNAIVAAGRCECGRRRATLGPPGGGPKDARWCPHCPGRPSSCVPVADAAEAKQAPPTARGPPDGAAPEPGPCVCGKATATLALPIQMWLAKWCPDCPGRPRNAISSALRCACGRRKATLGLPDGPVRWCSRCPDRPPEASAPARAVRAASALPSAEPRAAAPPPSPPRRSSTRGPAAVPAASEFEAPAEVGASLGGGASTLQAGDLWPTWPLGTMPPPALPWAAAAFHAAEPAGDYGLGAPCWSIPAEDPAAQRWYDPCALGHVTGHKRPLE